VQAAASDSHKLHYDKQCPDKLGLDYIPFQVLQVTNLNPHYSRSTYSVYKHVYVASGSGHWPM